MDSTKIADTKASRGPASSWRLFDIQARAILNKPLSLKEVVIMTWSIRKMIVVGLCVVLALFLRSPIQAEEKIKLTGDEIKELTKPGTITIGVNNVRNTVWICEVLEDGTRHVYWRSILSRTSSGEATGTIKIVGDQRCSKWGNSEERCYDIYRIGNDKYESWWAGDLCFTWYRAN